MDLLNGLQTVLIKLVNNTQNDWHDHAVLIAYRTEKLNFLQLKLCIACKLFLHAAC